MGVDTIHNEGQNARLFLRSADQTDPWNGRERFRGLSEQVSFVSLDAIESKLVHIVDRGGEANYTGNIGRARFKFVGNLVVGGFFEGYRKDHVTTTLIGRHGVEQCGLAVQNANSRRAVEFVTGEYIEVAIELAHVHGKMRHRLCPVHDNNRVVAMRQLHHLTQRIDCAESIGNVRHRYNLRPRPEQACKLVKNELASIIDGCHAKHGAFFFA